MDENTDVTRQIPGANPTQDITRARTGRQGPHAAAVVLGLVAMLFAGLVIARETMSWSVDWSRLAPGAIVGVGVVMVVIAVIGLVRRHDSR